MAIIENKKYSCVSWCIRFLFTQRAMWFVFKMIVWNEDYNKSKCILYWFFKKQMQIFSWNYKGQLHLHLKLSISCHVIEDFNKILSQLMKIVLFPLMHACILLSFRLSSRTSGHTILPCSLCNLSPSCLESLYARECFGQHNSPFLLIP